MLTSLYIVKQKNFVNEKNVKTTTSSYAHTGCGSSCNVEILSSFNPELQLKDIESTIKNKLMNLLSKLRGFKFV